MRLRGTGIRAWLVVGSLAWGVSLGGSARLAGQDDAPAKPKKADPGARLEVVPSESPTPQVEIHIPSMTALVEAAKRSHTRKLVDSLAEVVAVPENETGEGVDPAEILHLLGEVANWPDTSVTFTTYTQDREGRPRWALCLDWPIKDFRKRMAALLEHEAAKKVLKDVTLREDAEGRTRIELPDMVLGIIARRGDGSMLISSDGLAPPETVFGQQTAEEAESGRRTKRSLVYCRLNLKAADDDGQSAFAGFSALSDIKFGMSLDNDGLWAEKLLVTWNPLLGTVIKAAVAKVDRPFDCPNSAYVDAVFNIALPGLAESFAGLGADVLGDRVRGDVALSVLPGDGFLPIPDLFWQFHIRRKPATLEAIREHLAKDAEKRRENDEAVAWRETKVDEDDVFWRDPSADGPRGIVPVSFRTVIFFTETAHANAESRTPIMVVAQTSTDAEGAVKRWKKLIERKSAVVEMPESKDVHWQAHIRWQRIYGLLQPYLSILAGFAEGAGLPPTTDAIKDVLTDSQLDIRIQYAGLEVRHRGPIPIGAVYVPAVAAMSLGASGSPTSEAERERVACRNLRVLHHHAKLFNKDFGRWPATVAELDGYIDFSSHPDLLRLQPKARGFFEGLAVGMFASTDTKKKTDDEEESAIDDSLYTIEWSRRDWRLAFREGEFKSYATIAIDANGEIHRISKGGESPKKTETKKKSELRASR